MACRCKTKKQKRTKRSGLELAYELMQEPQMGIAARASALEHAIGEEGVDKLNSQLEWAIWTECRRRGTSLRKYIRENKDMILRLAHINPDETILAEEELEACYSRILARVAGRK